MTNLCNESTPLISTPFTRIKNMIEISHNETSSLTARESDLTRSSSLPPFPDTEQESRSIKEDSAVLNRHNVTVLVMVAGATAATLGYDVGIMAAAIQPLERQLDLTGVQKEIAMGSLNFVAAFGGILGGKIADGYGRKNTIALCCWLFIVGTVLMAASLNYTSLLLGRSITGLGVGVAFVTAPCYITEVAPAESRGQLNAVFDISINGGILWGYIVGFLVQLIWPDNWRLMLGCGVTLPILVLGSLSRLPESPRWLMMNRDKSEAKDVLLQLGNSHDESQQILQEMQEELDRTKRELENSSSSMRFGEGQRYAIQLGFWQQITGTEAVLYYSADFLKRAGLESPLLRLGGNISIGICKLVPECIATRYIDSAGRRPLLCGSALALFLSTTGLSIVFWAQASPGVIVIFLCAIMASFSAGLGPFTFLSASENLSMSERAMGLTYCTAANRITSGTVAMTAVTLTEILGDAGLFGLYAAAGLLSLFFYWRVPETVGLSLEELAAARTTKTSNNGSHTLLPPSDQTELVPATGGRGRLA
jgi:sugar porter (SP) family MFS transporter